MSLPKKSKSSTRKRSSRSQSAPVRRVDSFPDAFELVKQYEKLYPHGTLKGRKQVVENLQARIKAARALSQNPNVPKEEQDKALAFAKVYEESLKKLPAPENMPKKVSRPRRSGLGGRGRKPSATDLRKREELTRLMTTPSMVEEMKPPPTLRVKKWKHEPRDTEFFVGRELTLIGKWPMDEEKQLGRYRRVHRQYRRAGYETGVAQWNNTAYLYARPTKRSGRVGEFVRQRYPPREHYRKTRRYPIPFAKRQGTYRRVRFYDSLGRAESAQNILRRKGFATQMFPYSKGRKGGKTEIGYVIYARHIKDPERKPVVGGGATGRVSRRRVRVVSQPRPTRGIGIDAGDKMDRWIDGKKTTLHRHMELTYSPSKVNKEYDRLRKLGHAVVLKSYTSDAGVTYYTLFKSEGKTKGRAKDYREQKKSKKATKLVPAPPRWPKEKSPMYVTPAKPHAKAVLVLEASATDPDGQQAIIKRQKALKEYGVRTEVVFGTNVTHLYAIPARGAETLVLPKRFKTKLKKPKVIATYGTEEYWSKRGVDIKKIERERAKQAPLIPKKKRRSKKT